MIIEKEAESYNIGQESTITNYKCSVEMSILPGITKLLVQHFIQAHILIEVSSDPLVSK